MNRYSLSTKITFIFAITFVLVCALFVLLYKVQTDKSLDFMEQRQFQSMNYLLQLYRQKTTPKDIEAYFNYFGLKRVANQNLAASVLERGEITFQKTTPIGRFSSIIYNDRYYLFITNKNIKVLLESQDGKNSTDHLWIGFILALAVLVSTYISIIRSFRPLQILNKSIRKFAGGDMNIEYKINEKNEIGEVACEFFKATKKISHLILSRQLFLRAIMHELKTPIGKGRIVSEMVHDDIQKKRLVDIFERLDLLINEFSKIEQLISQSYQLHIQEYPISSLIEQALDMMMLDEKQIQTSIQLDIQDEIVLADFDVMSLALKNLIDNALKYSEDKVIFIQSIENGLRFKNNGKELEYPIEYYFEAFITTSKKDTKSMGLGLYIVKNILEYHGYILKYSYQDQSHNFDILWST